MNFADYLEQVCAAIAVLWPTRRGVTPERFICFGADSLGVDGDDAVDLLMHLRKRFGTSFEQFPYDRYFGPEAGPPLGFLWKWLTGRPLEKLTVRDLARYMWNERQSLGH
ncbi:MAG: hypothetical protein DI527_20760 [Chelatococcus sp.]|nr:MAG: hypothetical protein DI527_20760 [Chelatococcus sp.]